MKRIFKLCIAILILSLCFVGCSKANINLDDNISDLRTDIFVYNCDYFCINITTGYREEPYDYDGKTNALTPLAVVCAWRYDGKAIESIEFEINNTKISAILTKNPFNTTYMCDLEQKISSDSNISFRLNSSEEYINLTNLTSTWEVDYAEAINIGKLAIEDKINSNTKDGIICGEFYLKIIYNELNTSKYFWYFAFYDVDGTISSAVIDPETKQILAII